MWALIKDLINYRYTVICFKEIINNAVIAKKYYLKTSDGEEENLRLTRFGVLYMFVPVPIKLEVKDHDEFLNTHMQLLNESFIELGLMGVIKMDVRIFRDKEIVQDNDKGEITIDRYIYLLKFKPIIRTSSIIKTLIILTVTTTLFLIFKKDIYSLFNI